MNDNTKIYLSKDVTLTAKGIAVIMMLFHHLFSNFPGYVEKYSITSFFLPMNIVMALSSTGKICVCIFIFFSSYGMTISLGHFDNSTVNKYTIRRYTTLLSNYLFVFLIGILTSFLNPNGLSVYFYKGEGLRVIFYLIVDALGLSDMLAYPTYNPTWWYMSVAILLIFMLPFFIRLYESFGVCTIAVSLMISYLGIPETSFTRYFVVMFLGIFLAKENVVSSLYKLKRSIQKFLFLFGTTTLFTILCFVRYRLDAPLYLWAEAFIALLFALGIFCITDLLHVKIKVLTYIGKHSTNIFLIHTLLFAYYFTDFVYSFKYCEIITLILLIMSLLFSIIIEYIKGLLHHLIFHHLKVNAKP